MCNRPEVRERTRALMENPRREDISPFSSRPYFFAFYVALALMLSLSNAFAQAAAPGGTSESEVQLTQPPAQGQAEPPITVIFSSDALDRARKLDPTFLGAVSDSKSAKEDRIQARNAMLPTISATTQYLGTQGDGVYASGRFVTNDGVHVYRAWGVLHQDFSPAVLMGTGYTRAKAAEALANAKAEIARRGLTVAVSKFFYTLVVAQRKICHRARGARSGRSSFWIIRKLGKNRAKTLTAMN